jgi:hypothetical protein
MLLRYEQREIWEVNDNQWVNFWKVVRLLGLKVVSFRCGPWNWYRGGRKGENILTRGRVGEDRGSKEMDGCPLTLPPFKSTASQPVRLSRRLLGLLW